MASVEHPFTADGKVTGKLVKNTAATDRATATAGYIMASGAAGLGTVTDPCKTSQSSYASGSGTIYAYVNGTVVKHLDITGFAVAISGPNELNWGGSATYSVTNITDVSYSWKTGYLLYISGSTTGSSVLVFAPSTPGPDTTDKVFCSVTLNGFLTSLQTPVIEIE